MFVSPGARAAAGGVALTTALLASDWCSFVNLWLAALTLSLSIQQELYDLCHEFGCTLRVHP